MKISKFLKHVGLAAALMPPCFVLGANAEPSSAAAKETPAVAQAAAPVKVIASSSDKAAARPVDAMLDAKAMSPADDERYRNAIQIVANPACTARSPCMLA